MKRIHKIRYRTLVVVWFAALLSAVTPATWGDLVTVDVDLALTPPAAPINAFTLTVTAKAMSTTKHDSDTANVTGNVLADLGIEFDPVTHAVTSVDQLEFTGGRFNLSDVQFELDYGFFGSVNATGTGISGTLETPDPPGSVTGGTFNTAEHLIVLDDGQFHAYGTDTIGGLFDPITVDLAAEPIEATAKLTGILEASLLSVVGNTATYGVTMRLPVDFDEEAYNQNSVVVSVAATGTVQATGQFTRTVPVTLTWGGSGDGTWSPSNRWTGGVAGQVPDQESRVTVPANTVTIDANAEAYTLSITGAGRVAVDAGSTLAVGPSVTVGDHGRLDVAGTLSTHSVTVEGLLNVHPGGTATIADVLTVAAGGKLSGGGTINAKTIAIAGDVSPGAASGGIGTLTVGGATTLVGSSKYDVQVSLAAVDVGADLIELSATGSLQIGGTLSVSGIDRTDSSINGNATRKIVDNTAGGTITGTFLSDDPTSHIGQGAFLRDVIPTATGVDLELLIALGGDVDGDGQVGLDDWDKFRANFGRSETDWTEGNFDPWNDVTVDLDDWDKFRANFGKNYVVAVAEGGAAAVPEPGTLVMLLGGLAGLAGFAVMIRLT